MPHRKLFTSISQVRRLVMSKKFFITRVTGIKEAQTFTLTPQGTTNPGTKGLPWIYFGRINSEDGFNHFRNREYPGATYILVPEDSTEGKGISWRSTGPGGDYVKTSSLAPEDEQYVVSIGDDFDNPEMAAEPATKPVEQKNQSWLEICRIM